MVTKKKLSPAQKEAGRKMRLLFSKLSGMKKVPSPLLVHTLPLGLGVKVGYCCLPGRKIAIGFTKKSGILPIALAEGNRIKPLPKLKTLVKAETITLVPSGRGEEIAQVPDSFGNSLTLGRVKKEGAKWGLKGIRLPLPKSALSSLSMPSLLSTLFMGVYLPSILAGFPLISPHESVPYHFLTQSPLSAISSLKEERVKSDKFGLSTCGFEEAGYLAVKDIDFQAASGREMLDPLSLSSQNGHWIFSSPVVKDDKFLEDLGCHLDLCRFAAEHSPYSLSYWKFLDVMEEVLKKPLSFSPFESDLKLAQFASSQAKEMSGSLDAQGEWDFRKAFFSIADLLHFPLPVLYSVSSSFSRGKAVLLLNVGKPCRIPEFLAPHPLGRRYLLFLFSLSVARALCAVAFGVDDNLKEVELFIESGEFRQKFSNRTLLAKGSFEREVFFKEESEKDAEDFFNARFKGEIVKSPYFSPIISAFDWRRSPFVSLLHSKMPESSWDEIPKKFVPALGTSFVADLSIERKGILWKACKAFTSLSSLVKDGKMEKVQAVEKVESICELLPDPELKRAGNLTASLIKDGEPIAGFDFSMEEEIRRAQEEAEKLLSDKSMAPRAVRLLEEKVREADSRFDLLPLAPARYFNTYTERIIYNRLLSSGGEYTVLLPNSLFSAHVALEEMISKHGDSDPLEQANWQVLHAPATPLSHLNQYKEFSRLRDWEAAHASAMNMLEVSVENRHVAMAYRNLGYCFWMEGEIALASACYRLACSLDSSEDVIRTENWILERVARSSHVLLPDAEEILDLLKDRSVPVYPDLPGVKIAKAAAEALVDFGLFVPAENILSSLSTLPDSSLLAHIAFSLFT